MRVVRDFVEAGGEWISSRDIGAYLKSIAIADSNMLDELKQAHGGLRTFLMERACNLFELKVSLFSLCIFHLCHHTHSLFLSFKKLELYAAVNSVSGSK